MAPSANARQEKLSARLRQAAQPCFPKGLALGFFSFDGVGKIAEKAYREMMAKELPEDSLTAAAKMQASLEAQRKSNIALYEEDGLMPYQREQRKMIDR